MEEERLALLRERFEAVARRNGQDEYWYADDIARLLDIDARDLDRALERSRAVCGRSGRRVADHFQEEPSDGGPARVRLSRYACYLVARKHRDELRGEWCEVVVYSFPFGE